MKKLFIFMLLVVSSLLLFSCSKKEEYVGGDFEVSGEVKLNTTQESLTSDYTYKDSYFKNPATENNNDLAILSFEQTLAASTVNKGNHYENSSQYLVDFYNNTKFSNIFIPEDYKIKPTSDTIGYVIASKKVVFDNVKYLLVSIGVRGSGYDAEWASNFTLGKEGNHLGFETSANKVLDELKNYLATYNTEGLPLKIWSSGYSRGGAVAGLLGTKIVDEKIADINNTYIYTIEAPASYAKNDKEYKNIINYVNPNDIIPKVLNDKIGLVRPGVDFDFTNGKDFEKVKERALRNNPNIKLDISDKVKEVSDKLLNIIYSIDNIRTVFVDEYQDKINYGLNIIMSLDDNLRTDLLRYYQNKFTKAPLSILSLDGLTGFVTQGLDIFNITYDQTKIKDLCNTAFNLITEKVIGEFKITELTSITSEISGIIYHHFQSVTEAYLKA